MCIVQEYAFNQQKRKHLHFLLFLSLTHILSIFFNKVHIVNTKQEPLAFKLSK